MSKLSTVLLEQGIQTPSPVPDLVPAETKNQPRTHIEIGTADGGTSLPPSIDLAPCINGYSWRSSVGNRGGIQYIVVNAEARRSAGVKAGDLVTIAPEPDVEKREIKIPSVAEGTRRKPHSNAQRIVLYSQERIHHLVFRSQRRKTPAVAVPRRMKQMLATGKVIS